MRFSRRHPKKKRAQQLAERLLKFPTGVCARSHLSGSLQRLCFLPCGKAGMREGPRRTTSLPLLLISLIAAMKGTGHEEWNYEKLLYTLLSNTRRRACRGCTPRLCKGYGTWPSMCKLQALPAFPYDTSRKWDKRCLDPSTCGLFPYTTTKGSRDNNVFKPAT